jgi:hypothetical protein
VTEPAEAAATRLAIAAGVALEEEEAGNRVARLTLDGVEGELARAGFSIRAAERYAMFYRHEPGLPTRLMSRRRLLGPARRGFAAANGLIGGAGNKLVVTAVRD